MVSKASPATPNECHPQVAPYHLRLDWMIWFLPFSVAVTARGIRVRGFDIWFLRFIQKLLKADAAILSLMGNNPFSRSNRRQNIRALFYHYRYTDAKTKAATGAWWTRELLGAYMQPMSIEDIRKI